MDDLHKQMGLPRLRETSFTDYAYVVALESKYALETKSYEEWEHLWINNPAYTQLGKRLPIGWVLEDETKQVVGSLGNVPLFYELEGRRLLASVARAWVVDTRYRSYAPWLLEEYFSQKVVDLFLNATVGPLAAEAFAAFESSPAPVGAWDRSAFWITNYRGFVTNWLAMKAFPLAKPLSYPLSVAVFLRDTLATRQLRQHDTRVEVEPCTEVDGRFDIFWDALKKVNSHTLMGVRNREALQWHFEYALRQNKAWIITARKGSELTAYAIFLRYDNPQFGLRRVRLVDFQTLDGNTCVLVSMLSWALQKCRNEQIDMLESIGFRAEKRDLITKVAPYGRKLPSWLYFYRARDKNLAERLSDSNVWDPCQFDGDASL